MTRRLPFRPLAVATLLTASFALAACGDDGKTTVTQVVTAAAPTVATTAGTPTTSSAPEPYPDEVRTNFVRACVKEAGEAARSVCECALERIEAQMSYKEFRAAELAIADGGETPRVFTESISGCSTA